MSTSATFTSFCCRVHPRCLGAMSYPTSIAAAERCCERRAWQPTPHRLPAGPPLHGSARSSSVWDDEIAEPVSGSFDCTSERRGGSPDLRTHDGKLRAVA